MQPRTPSDLALILFDGSAKEDPYRRSDEAKCAEHEESRCEANPLRNPAAKSRAECRTGTLNRDDSALREIDATGSIERARDHPWHRDTQQADTDAVQDLDGSDPPPAGEEVSTDAAQWQ